MTTQLLLLWRNKKTEYKKRGFSLIICLYCDKIKTVFLQIMAHRKVVLCLLGATLAASLFSGCSGKKSDPVSVTVCTYYNGDQLDTFKDLTEKFNDTVGKKDGITVETKSLGTAEDLEQNVLAAADGEVGASEVPNIFSAYSDTAYTMDQKDMLVDLSGYLTDKEKSEYVEEYLKEGDFSDDGSKMF